MKIEVDWIFIGFCEIVKILKYIWEMLENFGVLWDLVKK